MWHGVARGQIPSSVYSTGGGAVKISYFFELFSLHGNVTGENPLLAARYEFNYIGGDRIPYG
jgi:hypothetical protein